MLFFRKLIKNFNESNLNTSKSSILSRVFGEICATQNRVLWTRDKCSGLQLQPKEFVDPIPNEKILYYYDASKMEIAMRLSQNATIIHVREDENLEKEMWQHIDTNNVLQTITKKNCPQTYKDSEYFLYEE